VTLGEALLTIAVRDDGAMRLRRGRGEQACPWIGRDQAFCLYKHGRERKGGDTVIGNKRQTLDIMVERPRCVSHSYRTSSV